MFPKRGEVHLIVLDPILGKEIGKTRPALVVSNDFNNQYAETITVAPITSAIQKVYPFEVLIEAGVAGLNRDSKVKCNQIRTVDKRRLVKLVGRLPEGKMEAVNRALEIHLGLR